MTQTDLFAAAAPGPRTDIVNGVCRETRRRICVAVAAWAYEKHADPVMSDSEFDALAASIDLGLTTRRPDMDAWFRANFAPHTGLWVLRHPEPEGLERIYRMLKRKRAA